MVNVTETVIQIMTVYVTKTVMLMVMAFVTTTATLITTANVIKIVTQTAMEYVINSAETKEVTSALLTVIQTKTVYATRIAM